MEISEIKEEVKYSGDLKVKEENLSSFGYEAEVTSELDIKPKVENLPQSHPNSVTNEEIQNAIDNTVKPDRDPAGEELELELKPKNTFYEQYESEGEDDSNKQQPPQISQISQAHSVTRNQNVPKRKKRCVKIQKRQLLQCTLCSQSFTRVGLLITHARNKHATIQNPSSVPISDNEDEFLYQCPLCSKSLKRADSLRNHFLNFHTKNKPFQCSLCLESKNEIKKFSTKLFLKIHIAQVHVPARFKFQCDICSHTSKTSSQYRRHKKIHIDKNFKCDYCSMAYKKKESMLRHIIAVHKECTDRHKTVKCNFCEKLFCSKKDLDGHVLQTHVVDTVQCKICLKKFREEMELRKHLEVSHRANRTWLVCDVCSKVFKNNKDLVQHLEVEHKRFFKCRKCFKSFVSKKDYESHSIDIVDKKGRNSGNSQLQCKICHVFLKTECALITHKDTHLKTDEIGIKNVIKLPPGILNQPKCDSCPQMFLHNSLLLEHAKKCHPNQKWECKSCDKSFHLKFQLVNHERLHFKSKPFKCKVCLKSFSYLRDIKNHEETHKKDKKYKCTLCTKSYAVSLGLRFHMANHYGGEKPFKCHICQMAFAFKKTLAMHLQGNPEEGPFGCKKCSHRYKSVKQLRYHQQRSHSENRIAQHSRGNRRDGSYKSRVGPHLKYFEDLVYVCALEECKFETKDEKEVAIHNAMHGLPLLVLSRELPPGPSVKSLGSSSSTSASAFREIIQKRMVRPRYKCKYCSKMYKVSRQLCQHIKEKHPASRVEHTKTVHQSPEKKRYTCSRCEKSFAGFPGLMYHVAVHHEEKPFKCDNCKMAFAFKRLLEIHSLSHTDARPFQCSECSYSGKCAQHLRRHQQRAHPENPLIKYGKPWLDFVSRERRSKYAHNLVFVCGGEECDFETKDEKEVAAHYVKHYLPKVNLSRLVHGPSSQVVLSKSTRMKNHMIEARYKCNQCSITFSKPYGLKRHMREFHVNGQLREN